jgi:hypothetical protein
MGSATQSCLAAICRLVEHSALSTAAVFVASWLAGATWINPIAPAPPAPDVPQCRQIDNCAPVQQGPDAITIPTLEPPPQYDFPFKGKLYLSAENDLEAMALVCGIPRSRRPVHGCAQIQGWLFGPSGMGAPKWGECIIFIAKRKLVEDFFGDYDMVIRHERAHCNGWRHQ